VLVANAGILGAMQPPELVEEDNWKNIFAVNVVRPSLLLAAPSRHRLLSPIWDVHHWLARFAPPPLRTTTEPRLSFHPLPPPLPPPPHHRYYH
jgi:hypothetical protein